MNHLRPDIRDRTFPKLLRAQAALKGDEPFLRYEDAEYTFAEVHGLANSYARRFQELGVTKGATVATLLRNDRRYIFSVLGLWQFGGVWVPINPDLKGEYLRRALAGSDARVLVVDADLLDRVHDIWQKGLPIEHVVVHHPEDSQSQGMAGASWCALDDFGSGDPSDVPGTEDVAFSDLSAVMFTSGTTGWPKGVMQSHHAWIAGVMHMSELRDFRDGDCLYSCLPMQHSGPWFLDIFPALLTGLPVALDRRFSVEQFWDRCRRFGATHASTLGAMHIFLWNQPERPDDADNPVRVSAFMPLPSRIEKDFLRRFGIQFNNHQTGQTECLGIALADKRPAASALKPDSCGFPRSDLHVQILDDDDFPVPPDTVGEICVRPKEPAVILSGFWNNAEATAAAWRNLWYHTGDLGRIDEDGEMFFVDRKADFMRYKGRNISSLEVEEAAARHPEVLEAAAHGVQSDELETEDEVKLCVAVKPGSTLTAEGLARFINDTAPYYFVPRYIEFFEEDFPRTPSGRVQKFKLRERGVTPQTWDRDVARFKVAR